uniref:Uncharacterized protein n=1 Tax=Arundo donax TaxID=35708 RepID=A0A0A9C2U8_ARUDO
MTRSATLLSWSIRSGLLRCRNVLWVFGVWLVTGADTA